MSVKGVFTVSALAVALAGPAMGEASYSVGLEGYVPTVCRLTLDGSAVTEFCNDPNGYEIWADYAPGASLTVDGQPVALSDTGSTLVSASQTAAFRIRQMTAEGPVSLRIVPL